MENNIYKIPNVLEEQNKALEAVLITQSDAGLVIDNKEDLFIVWGCYILGHRKFMIGSKNSDRYFEVTYNSAKQEWYVDIYKKTYNLPITDKELKDSYSCD